MQRTSAFTIGLPRLLRCRVFIGPSRQALQLLDQVPNQQDDVGQARERLQDSLGKSTTDGSSRHTSRHTDRQECWCPLAASTLQGTPLSLSHECYVVVLKNSLPLPEHDGNASCALMRVVQISVLHLNEETNPI